MENPEELNIRKIIRSRHYSLKYREISFFYFNELKRRCLEL